jgi:hypothetical protein
VLRCREDTAITLEGTLSLSSSGSQAPKLHQLGSTLLTLLSM